MKEQKEQEGAARFNPYLRCKCPALRVGMIDAFIRTQFQPSTLPIVLHYVLSSSLKEMMVDLSQGCSWCSECLEKGAGISCWRNPPKKFNLGSKLLDPFYSSHSRTYV